MAHLAVMAASLSVPVGWTDESAEMTSRVHTLPLTTALTGSSVYEVTALPPTSTARPVTSSRSSMSTTHTPRS